MYIQRLMRYRSEEKSAERVLKVLRNSKYGYTVKELSEILNLHRHTVTKILERLLLEKKVDYIEKGPLKIYFAVGEKKKFEERIDVSKYEKIWIDVIERADGKVILRINQTKRDVLAKKKFRSVGAVAIEEHILKQFIEAILKASSVIENLRFHKKTSK